MKLPPKSVLHRFQRTVLAHFESQGRDFPWRRTRSPYRIWVSEVMLQQTQTDRVRERYREFLKIFPTVSDLASASPAAVLKAWSGLGYNRRALNLLRAAVIVTERYGGQFPKTQAELRELPGIGAYSAAAICCFAWNQPAVFVETNIRTVFIHSFFADKSGISDESLYPLIEATIDRSNPRRWYYALMDYGSFLKRQHPGIGKRSRHYVRQSPFAGSQRQLRGKILKSLTRHPCLSARDLSRLTGRTQAEVKKLSEALITEGFLRRKGSRFELSGELKHAK